MESLGLSTNRETGNRTRSFCLLPFEVIRFDSIRLQLALESLSSLNQMIFVACFLVISFALFCARLSNSPFLLALSHFLCFCAR